LGRVNVWTGWRLCPAAAHLQMGGPPSTGVRHGCLVELELSAGLAVAEGVDDGAFLDHAAVAQHGGIKRGALLATTMGDSMHCRGI
jgi:hypothetical protein